MGERSPVKYHYFYRFFTYSVRREPAPFAGALLLAPSGRASRAPVTRSEDLVRRGV